MKPIAKHCACCLTVHPRDARPNKPARSRFVSREPPRRRVARQHVLFEKNYRLQDIQLSKSFPSYRARPLSQAQRAGNSFSCRTAPRRAPR
jgi:hypothetical protein